MVLNTLMLMQQVIKMFQCTIFDVISLWSYHLWYLFNSCKILCIIRMCLGATHELIYILWYLTKSTNTGSCVIMKIHNHWCLIYFQRLFLYYRRLLICQIFPCSIYTGIWKELIQSLSDYQRDHILALPYNAQNSTQVVCHFS